MPVYRIQAPDGTILRIEAATEADAVKGAQQYKATAAAPTRRFQGKGDSRQSATPQTVAAAKNRSTQLALNDARARAKSTPGFLRSVSEGATFGASNILDAGGAAIETGIGNLGKRIMGKTPAYGMGDAYNAVRTANAEARDDFSTKHPIANIAGNVVGGVAGAVATAPMVIGRGALAAGRWASGAGVMQSTAKAGATGRLLASSGRTAAIAAPGGAAAGLMTSRPGREVNSTVSGAGMGAMFGAASPVVGSAATTLGKPVINFAKRGANKVFGGRLLDPMLEAQQRLGEAMMKDGLHPTTIQREMAEWKRVGGVSPSLLDVAPQGGHTQSLIRGAASKAGPARSAVVEYRERVGGEVADAAIERAKKLTPSNRSPAAVVQKRLEAVRKAQADIEYMKPYAERVPVSGFELPLSGSSGTKALRSAIESADANKLNPDIRLRLPELRSMLDGDEGVDSLSVGSLDQVKRAYNRLAETSLNTDLQAGYGGQANAIRDELGRLSPLYDVANKGYARRSNVIDAIDVGAEGYKPGTVGDLTRNLGPMMKQSPKARAAAAIGYRDRLAAGLGENKPGNNGLLNNVKDRPNQIAKQDFLFGPKRGADFRQSIDNMVTRQENAAFADVGTGSQTFDRYQNLPTSRPGLFQLAMMAIDKVARGIDLSDAERLALVQLGTNNPQNALKPPPRSAAKAPAINYNPTRGVSSVVAPWLSQYGAMNQSSER